MKTLKSRTAVVLMVVLSCILVEGILVNPSAASVKHLLAGREMWDRLVCLSLYGHQQQPSQKQDPLTSIRIGNYGVPVTMVVGSTSYSHTERRADKYSARCIGACKFKLQYPSERQMGVVAVDPKHVPLGSIVLATVDGKTFVFIAGDAGGTAVIKRTAVKVRAVRRGITDARADALVFDFFMPGCKQVGKYWTEVVVIPYQGAKPFVKLNESSQKAYLRPEVWVSVLAKNHAQSDNGSFVATR